MNREYISLTDSVVLEETLVMKLTDTPRRILRAKGLDPDDVFKKLSRLKRILVTRDQKRGDRELCFYHLHTEFGIFLFVANNERNAYKITSFRMNNLNDQNKAVKFGKIIDLPSGFNLIYTKDLYNRYKDGIHQKIEYNKSEEAFNGEVFNNQCIRTIPYLDAIFDKEKEPEEQKSTGLSSSTRKVLDLASLYAQIDFEVQNKVRQEIGRLFYHEVQPLLYERRARIPYIFGMDEFPAHAFKKGTQVQVGLDPENMLTAEVIEVDEADKTRLEGDYLALLFNKLISYEDIPPQGFIELTESTVIKDVQMGAIENITEGKARADYMDRLFSKPQSMGFNNKKLSEVMDKLMKKKYPPNESQREAIAGGIKSKDAFFVMGPPGTGKTTVILEWVKYFVLEENKRVLISSQNNKAVDNVLERLREEEGIDLIRIGSEGKLQSEIVPFILENKIKTLQKRITENCSESMSEITALTEEGPFLLQKERVLFEAYRDFCEVEKRTSEKVKAEYLPLYSSLSGILYRYQQTALKSSVHYLAYEKLRSRRDLLKEKKENVFRNLYGSFLEMREKIKLKRYNRYVPKLAKSAEEYNSLRGALDEAEQKLHKEEGKAYYEARLLYEMKNRETRSFEESLQNPYDLLHTIRFEEGLHRSEASFQLLKEEIEAEIERGRSIAIILGEWKEENETKSSYALQEMVLQSANVVGATCIGVSSQKKFQDIRFDVTIIDEAGQIQIHNALVPMSVSEKLIMLGDHKQIPPIVDEEVAQGCEDNNITTEYLEKSLFEILYDKMPEQNKMMLDKQYRMPKEIADLISEEFYHGAYQSPNFKAESAGVLEGISDKPLVLIDTSEDFNRFDEQLEGEGYRNSWEAKIVRDVASHLKDLDVDPSEIGIISAYKSQVAAMKRAMRTLYREDRLHEMVATLDSFQGQERDVIIYSFTRSSGRSPHSSRVGFLKELRRLNVAMTRAKKTLVLVGDFTYLSGCMKMEKEEGEESVLEGSEKRFGQFMTNLLQHVDKGYGERITSRELEVRILQMEGDQHEERKEA